MSAATIADALGGRRTAAGWIARCPAHDDRTPSLSVSERDGRVLVRCHAGCPQDAVIAALRERGLWADGGRRDARTRPVVATYPYTDESGALLYESVRYIPKDFKQRQPNGKGGWAWNLDGVRRVIYRLPELLAADPNAVVYIAEGEKDVDALRALGFVATCNPCGSGQWRPEFNEALRGRPVAILPDNDDVGRRHAEEVARSVHGIARDVRVLALPNLPPKGDASDWIAAGGTRDQLEALAAAASPWTPSAASEDAATGADSDGDARARTATDGLVFTSIAALLNEPDETAEWLVDGLVPAGGLVVAVGKPKAGKSTLARNLCVAIALGEPFLGREVRQGRALYLALEEKRAQVRAHFRALGVPADAPLGVFVGTSPMDGLAQLAAALEREPAALVVVDPLFRLIRVRDGNDYAAMTAALDPVLALAHTSGACVLVTHHAPKGERADIDAPIGSTAIAGSADTLVVLKRSDRYRTLSTVQRVGDDLPDTVIELDPTTRAVRAGGTRQDADCADMKTAIMEYLTGLAAPVDEPTITAQVEGRTGAKREALRALVADGSVIREGTGRKGDAYRYCVSCSVAPDIGGERENKNPNSPENPPQSSHFSCSELSAESVSCSREAEEGVME